MAHHHSQCPESSNRRLTAGWALPNPAQGLAPELPCLALNHSLSVLGHEDQLVCGHFLRAALEKRFALTQSMKELLVFLFLQEQWSGTCRSRRGPGLDPAIPKGASGPESKHQALLP